MKFNDKEVGLPDLCDRETGLRLLDEACLGGDAETVALLREELRIDRAARHTARLCEFREQWAAGAYDEQD